MEHNFKPSLKKVLRHEGGFVNHPSDPGGATNKGITIGTFRRHVKRNGTVLDLKNITDAQVAKVYKKQYWDKVRADDLPDGLDYAVFDFAVNSGVSRSAKFLQRILIVTEDGVIGRKTLFAVMGHEAAGLIDAICADRLTFLKNLRTWKTFGTGWAVRVSSVEGDALRMAQTPPTQQSVSNPKPIPATPASKPPKTYLWARLCAFIKSKRQPRR